jgi:predicted nuclease with TOPRIM domain
MNLDKNTLQSNLDRLSQDFASLQAAVNDRQKELEQIEKRKSQLIEEIMRNQGAMAYNRVFAESLAKEMDKAVPAL